MKEGGEKQRNKFKNPVLGTEIADRTNTGTGKHRQLQNNLTEN